MEQHNTGGDFDKDSIVEAITDRQTKEAAREAARTDNRARKMTRYVLSNLHHGKTEMKARTNRLPSPFMSRLDDPTLDKLQDNLSGVGVTIERFSVGDGEDPCDEDWIRVTRVLDIDVQPPVEE